MSLHGKHANIVHSTYLPLCTGPTYICRTELVGANMSASRHLIFHATVAAQCHPMFPGCEVAHNGNPVDYRVAIGAT